MEHLNVERGTSEREEMGVVFHFAEGAPISGEKLN